MLTLAWIVFGISYLVTGFSVARLLEKHEAFDTFGRGLTILLWFIPALMIGGYFIAELVGHLAKYGKDTPW